MAPFVVYFVLVSLTWKIFIALRCFSQFKFFVGLLETSETFRVRSFEKFEFCLLIIESQFSFFY